MTVTAPEVAGLFRDAMAMFPSGITIVTTTDEDGRWWGFTASAFCAVSADPPLVLVCLASSAECHPVFERAQKWVVHIIHSEHVDLALRFATRGADKFADAAFTADADGLPILADPCVMLRCSLFARYDGGDHTILVGHVDQARVDTGQPPAVYFRRGFRPMSVPFC
jgi:flavin reductase ActVB